MKNMFRISCFLLAVLMLFSFAACGKDSPEPTQTPEGTEQTAPPAATVEGTTIDATLWDLIYDEADGWVYEEDDFYNNDTYSSISMAIPGEGEEENVVIAEVYVSIEEPYSFRDNLTTYGFDEYEYAVNQAYDFTPIGGVDCLKSEGYYWGTPCLRYFNRVEGAGASVFIQIIGEYEDERVEKLLSGLTIQLEDIGNVDGPWYWEGEPFAAEARSVMVGTYTIDSQWIPFTDCIMTKETFQHAAAAVGDQVFLLVNGELKRYDYDGTSLTFAEDIALSAEYENISADVSGNIWLSNFMEPLICWKDGAQTASYEGPDYVVMDPTGTWGISWFTSAECEKISFSDGTMKTEPFVFQGVDSVRRVMIDENHIYACGSDPDTGDHKVFVYDTAGSLQMTLADSDGSGLGSITFITETPNGFLALDGNMREIVLWTKDGTYIGNVDDGDLFGTYYPWFCGGTKLADGSILVIMTEDRADKSAMELVAFKLSGF